MAKQDKLMQGKITQHNLIHDRTIEDKQNTRQDMIRRYEPRQHTTSQGKTRPDQTIDKNARKMKGNDRQNNIIHDLIIPEKTRQ